MPGRTSSKPEMDHQHLDIVGNPTYKSESHQKDEIIPTAPSQPEDEYMYIPDRALSPQIDEPEQPTEYSEIWDDKAKANEKDKTKTEAMPEYSISANVLKNQKDMKSEQLPDDYTLAGPSVPTDSFTTDKDGKRDNIECQEESTGRLSVIEMEDNCMYGGDGDDNGLKRTDNEVYVSNGDASTHTHGSNARQSEIVMEENNVYQGN